MRELAGLRSTCGTCKDCIILPPPFQVNKKPACGSCMCVARCYVQKLSKNPCPFPRHKASSSPGWPSPHISRIRGPSKGFPYFSIGSCTPHRCLADAARFAFFATNVDRWRHSLRARQPAQARAARCIAHEVQRQRRKKMPSAGTRQCASSSGRLFFRILLPPTGDARSTPARRLMQVSNSNKATHCRPDSFPAETHRLARGW